MIVKRDDEIANFKKEKYYTVELELDGFTLSTERIDSLEVAEQLKNLLENRIEITDVIQTEKITKPDLPFDLTTLQRECNKYFGYSAKQTLDYAQSLYEKKLITLRRRGPGGLHGRPSRGLHRSGRGQHALLLDRTSCGAEIGRASCRERV